MHPARFAATALLLLPLAGCGARQPYFDVATPGPTEPYASVHLQFTPAVLTSGIPLRPAWSSTAVLFLGSSRDDSPTAVTVRGTTGRVQMEPLTEGLAWDPGRRALVGRVSSARVEGVRLRATGYGAPQEPGDLLTVESSHGTSIIQVWIEPTPGEWREAGQDGRELRLPVVAVHAALMRNGESARVLFFSPPRHRNPDGTPKTDTHFPVRGGGFDWNTGGLRDVEIAAWDLATNAVVPRPMEQGAPGTDRRNIFCSGHALLPNGKLLVAGGHTGAADHDADFLHVYTATDTGPSWRRVPQRMRWTRWYPTVTTLPDGIMLITSGRGGALTAEWGGLGDVASGWDLVRDRYELFDARGDSLLRIADGSDWYVEGDHGLATYPSTFVLPGGSGFPHGAVFAQERNLAHLFSYHPGTARPLRRVGDRVFIGGALGFAETHYAMATRGSRSFPYYGAAVLLPFAADTPRHTRILVTGGQNETNANHADYDLEQLATNTAEVFDFDNTRPLAGQAGWRGVGPLGHRRMLNDATLLPDGKVLVTGGAQRGWSNKNRGPVMEAELYDPVTEQFRDLAPARIERRYHSTALLLPDATVLKAGSTGGFDNDQTWIVPQFVAERYFPPYLWRGRRPVVLSLDGTGGPSQVIVYGQTFEVTVRADRPQRLRVGLMRLGSVTHGNNMDQRYVWLSEAFPRSERGPATVTLSVRTPRDGSIAPPGDYMLFVVDGLGVPSEARFVRLRAR